MALKFPNHTQETTTITGTGNILLDGAVAGYLSFGSQLGDNDPVCYGIFNADSPPDFEVGEGTYRTGTPDYITRDVVHYSTNGGSKVVWTSGTKNVVAAIAGDMVESLLDKDQNLGLVSRITDAYTFIRRTITKTNDAASLIALTNGSGAAGDPTFDLTEINAAHIDKRSAASEAVRTMSGRLVLGAADTIIKGLSTGKHGFYNDDAKTDQIGELERNAADDWVARLSVGGTLYDMLHKSNIADYLPRTAIATSTSTTFSTVQTASDLSVTIPAVGTWNLQYTVLLHLISNSTSVFQQVYTFDIQDTTSAPTGFTTRRQVNRTDRLDAATSIVSGLLRTVYGCYNLSGLSNSTTYNCRIANESASAMQLDANSGAGRIHEFSLRAYRTA